MDMSVNAAVCCGCFKSGGGSGVSDAALDFGIGGFQQSCGSTMIIAQRLRGMIIHERIEVGEEAEAG